MAHFLLKNFLQLHPSAMRRARSKRKIRIRPIYPNHANELWYKSELLKFVRFISGVTEASIIPMLRQETFGGDALTPSIAHQLTLLAGRFGNPISTARRLSRLAATRNLAATDKRLIANIEKALGVNIQPILSSDGVRDVMSQAVNDNINLIKSIPEEYFAKLRTELEKNFSAGERWEDLASIVSRVGHVTESRAKLIARDQTSKMNGAFNRARQTSVGIAKYKWLGMDDGRERPSHMANNGRIFRWDSPPEETGNPGDDVNCRCVAIPEFDLDGDDD